MTNQSSKPRSDSAFFAGFLSLFFLFGIGEALAGPPGNDRGGEPQEVRGVYFKYIADASDLPIIAFQYPLAGNQGYPHKMLTGRREQFDRDKLKRGILRACEKRPVSVNDIDQYVEDLERKILEAQKLVETRLRQAGDMRDAVTDLLHPPDLA